MVLQPLIAICGTTGVGKSRLAIELALEVCGKVINADAMQVYQGLDVLTNKTRREEQHGIQHVLMGFKEPGEQYIVGEWVRDARQEIDKAYSEGRVPIVVGGTSYWIQHLLFPTGLPAQAGSSRRLSTPPNAALENAVKTLPESLATLFNLLPRSAPSAKTDPDDAFALHRLLSHLDPHMARRWHWKDTRKVLRNLEIIKENGKTATDVLAETHAMSTNICYRTLIFWLHAQPDILKVRIEQRVDQMLSNGLLDEIRTVCQSFRDSSSTSSHLHWTSVHSPRIGHPDFTVGIFQAIGRNQVIRYDQPQYFRSVGFREFYDYILQGEIDKHAYNCAIAEMKQSTIKYARRQIKWIRNKLLPAVETNCREGSDLRNRVYLLDASDMSAWDERVLAHAKNITLAFLTGSKTPEPVAISDIAKEMLRVPAQPTKPCDVMLLRRKLICPTCTTEANRPVMLEEGREWEAHQHTTAHKRMLRRQMIESLSEAQLDMPLKDNGY